MANKKMWEGEGGGLDNYEFTIRAARFGHVARDNGDRPRLILEGEARTEDGRLVDWTEDYPICSAATASQWQIKPDGSEVENVAPDTWFHKRSGIIAFIKAARECGVPLEARSEATGLDPKKAALFVGWKLKMVEKTVSKFTPEGETEEVVVNYKLPVEYLGEAGGQDSGSSSTSANPTTPTTTSPTSNGAGTVDDDMLKLIATRSASFYDFITEATGMGVAISDPRLKEKTGVWAEVKG